MNALLLQKLKSVGKYTTKFNATPKCYAAPPLQNYFLAPSQETMISMQIHTEQIQLGKKLYLAASIYQHRLGLYLNILIE